MPADKGNRYNQDKPKISMVLEAPDAITGCARVLMHGEQKYARNNWKKGLPLTEIVDSLERHTLAFLNGEETDVESGLPHVDHILCNALFLSQLWHTRGDCDDRETRG